MSSPITTPGGLLELDPATLDRAITACEQLAIELARNRDGVIRTLPSASLRLGTLPSGQALATAYGFLWDGGEASLDGIVTSHIAIAEAMAVTLGSARDQMTGTDVDTAEALATLEALSKQGGTGAVLATSMLPATGPAETDMHGPLEALVKEGGTGALLAKGLLAAAAAVFNLSPRSPGYHALPVAVTEPFAVMGHAEIAAAATALSDDLREFMRFADSWREAGTALATAAEDAAAGLRVLPSGLSGELADRMIAAIEDHLVSLVTLGSVAEEIGGKLDTTVQGLSDAARAVPEIPVASATDAADPTGAWQARLAAEQQAALELARDAMELRYRPVVEDSADRVPLLPPPDAPTTDSDTAIAPQASGRPGGAAGTGSEGATGGTAAEAATSGSEGGAAGDEADARSLHRGPETVPAGTQPAGAAVASGETATAPRAGIGAGPGNGPGPVPGGQPGASGPGGMHGPGGPIAGGAASGGAPRGSAPGSAPGNGRPPSSGGTPRLPGGTLPPAASTAPSNPGTSSRPMMGGMAPMAPMAGGGAAGGQGHTPASYLTSKRNGHALVGDLPRTPRGIISGSEDIFDE
ncbi:hypothetical protein [Lolliginicoccus suaedae]|uniref:hypothetical protein n=1 Tax=Lolliginicoccus suaedae TaxID=2605429 RepID=UPI0011EFD361|nr:hypothetical protein [Lolliginicoccus suaedae]